MQGILQKVVFQNRVVDYAIFIATVILLTLAVYLIKKIVFHRLKKLADLSKNTLDDFLISILGKTLFPLLYYAAFYIGIKELVISRLVSKAVNVIGVFLLTYFTIIFVLAIIRYSIENYWLKKESDTARKGNVRILISIIKVIVWGTGIFFLLDNLGFKISTIIAGLGIGGIAVALAMQTILGDLFSYVAILLDKPFEIGDFVIVEDYLGTIEHIGVKTTRIRSLGGEQLVFSNSDLTNSRVKNYKRMNQRRVVFSIGVVYSTPTDNLKKIPVIISAIIKKIENTRFDRSNFSSFGDFSLNFETVYYVKSGDYNIYMDIQQQINLLIMEHFEKLGIEFAFPSQTIYMEK